MTHVSRRRRIAVLVAAHLTCVAALAAPGPAVAIQILEAADHAELSAQISATNVNRIALHGDRIARLVRAPDGFAVEHDAASGDLYLRPAGEGFAEGGPVTLFIGTERGFTYRLTLTPAARDSAQILIRNAAVLPDAASGAPASASDAHIAALVGLVRSVARREPVPGYGIETGHGPSAGGLTLIETWRGPRLAALVFEAARPASSDADGTWPPGSGSGTGSHRSGLAGLAGTIEKALVTDRVLALWVAAPGTGPAGGRLAVAVTETVPAGASR